MRVCAWLSVQGAASQLPWGLHRDTPYLLVGNGLALIGNGLAQLIPRAFSLCGITASAAGTRRLQADQTMDITPERSRVDLRYGVDRFLEIQEFRIGRRIRLSPKPPAPTFG